MDSNSKKHIRILIVLFILAFAGVYFNTFKLDINQSRAVKGEASLTIYFDADRARSFSGPIVDGMSPLQAVLASSLGGNFEVTYSPSPAGPLVIDSIAGQENFATHWWHFYLNKRLIINDQLDRIMIKKGDFIEVEFK